MKLLKLHIKSEFRGLNSGISLEFRNHSYYENDDKEPICLVGLNGSGKSNTLEALAEIFYYLELKTIVSGSQKEKIDKRFDFLQFQLSYRITSLKWKYLFSRHPSIPLSAEALVTVNCSKQKGENVSLIITDSQKPDQKWELPEELWKEALPDKVIGYSSGQNELISNPFTKLNFYYFQEFQKNIDASGSEVEANTELNRMFFMDYDSNELILLANFLFATNEKDISGDEKEKVNDVNNLLGIKALHSFRIRIQFRAHDDKGVILAPELNLGIEKLKRCATSWSDNEGSVKRKRDRIVLLDYYVDVGVQNAFRNEFKTAYELFRMLYLLRMMNIHAIAPKSRARVQEVTLGTNLNDLIPQPDIDRLIFKVESIGLVKKGVKEPVPYKHLSDGEHQLLHVLGTLKMMQENDVLFLLDEPETHFNPEWRAKMVRLILETQEEEYIEHDHFITSHSPFIISDCKPTNVYYFEKANGKRTVKTAHEMRLNTFGASVNQLTEEIFNKTESQGEYAGKTIKELMERDYKTQKEINQAKEDARVLGDSAEKALLFRKLLMLEDEIEKKDK